MLLLGIALFIIFYSLQNLFCYRLAVIAIHRRVVAWFADIEPDTDVLSLLPEFK